jgi:DNA-binding NarL/FixJ family response regulator
MAQELIKFAIADDHKIFRDGIKMSLAAREDLKLIWEAEDGKEMMHKIATKKPDVLLMDIRMPEIDGINALQILRKEYGSVKIIVLTMYDDEQMVNKMMEMGANAYLTKTTEPEEIYEAITTCMNEDFYFNDLVNKAILGKLQLKKNQRQNNIKEIPITFSEKEIRIIQLLAEDMSTDDISKVIFLSPRTIESIRQGLKTKADVKTIAGLVMYAVRNGLIE